MFDTIDEIDGVRWVGDATLQRLLDFARAEGWVQDDELYGRIEGVDFTVEQAAAVVLLANTASLDVLDDEVPLDGRAAQGIVDTRPFDSVEQVADVPYVGASALRALQDFALDWEPPGPVSTAAAQASLSASTADLVYMSDIDSPLEVVVVPGVTTGEASSDVKPAGKEDHA